MTTTTAFSMGTMAEEKAKQKYDFKPYEQKEYMCKVLEVGIDKQPKTDWSNGSPVKTDEMCDMIKIKFALLGGTDGEIVRDFEGKEVQNAAATVWLDPTKVGWNGKTKEPARTRAVLTAIMGVPTDSSLDIEKWEDLLLNEFKCYVKLITQQDGTTKNKFETFSIVKKK